MNRKIEIVNGKIYVSFRSTIYVLTVAEAKELANRLLSIIATIRTTPFEVDDEQQEFLRRNANGVEER